MSRGKLTLHTFPSHMIRPDRKPKTTPHRLVGGVDVDTPDFKTDTTVWMHPDKHDFHPSQTNAEPFSTGPSFALGVLKVFRAFFENRHHHPVKPNCHLLTVFMMRHLGVQAPSLMPDQQLSDRLAISKALVPDLGLPIGAHAVFQFNEPYVDHISEVTVRYPHSALGMGPQIPDVLQITGQDGYMALAPPSDWIAHLDARYPDHAPTTVHAAEYT